MELWWRFSNLSMALDVLTVENKISYSNYHIFIFKCEWVVLPAVIVTILVPCHVVKYLQLIWKAVEIYWCLIFKWVEVTWLKDGSPSKDNQGALLLILWINFL